MKITIYSANCVGNAANTIYPNKAEMGTCWNLYGRWNLRYQYQEARRLQ